MADFQTELEQFRLGLRRRESGGNYAARNRAGSGAGGAYQYMPGTWRQWASPAVARRYPEAWMAPAEIQDEVARRNMAYLFHKYGSWFRVAKAWLGGEGNVDNNVSDGHVTQNEYANQVLGYAGLAANKLAATGVTVPGGEQLSSATPDQLAAFGGAGPAAEDDHDPVVQLQRVLAMIDSGSTGGTTQPDPSIAAVDNAFSEYESLLKASANG